MKEVFNAIQNNHARYLGEGDWEKNSAYQAYAYNGKYYAILVNDSNAKWLEEDSLTEIKQEEVKEYVNYEG